MVNHEWMKIETRARAEDYDDIWNTLDEDTQARVEVIDSELKNYLVGWITDNANGETGGDDLLRAAEVLREMGLCGEDGPQNPEFERCCTVIGRSSMTSVLHYTNHGLNVFRTRGFLGYIEGVELWSMQKHFHPLIETVNERIKEESARGKHVAWLRFKEQLRQWLCVCLLVCLGYYIR